MKKRKQTDNHFPWWQYLLGSSILLAVLTFSGLVLLTVAQAPYQKAQKQLIQLAQRSADMVWVEQFTIFNGKKTYDSLLGKNSKGNELAVLKEEGSDQLFVYPLDQGVTKSQAERVATENGAGQIDRVRFGMLDEKPIWEVKSGTAYYVIDFETGALTSKEGL